MISAAGESVAAAKGSRKKQNTGNGKGKGRQSTSAARSSVPESSLRDEISLIVVLALAVLLFLCNFGLIGPVGDAVSHFLFGIFGMPAYAAPILIFLAVAFRLANRGESVAMIKLAAGVVLVFLAGIILDMTGGIVSGLREYDILAFYEHSSENRRGGGILFGSVTYLLNHLLDKTGTILVLIVLAIICIVIITEKSLLKGVRAGSRKVYESAVEDSNRRRERSERRRLEEHRRREEMRLKREQEEQEKILRMDRKVSGVILDTALAKEKPGRESAHGDDIHEIVLNEEETAGTERIRIHTAGAEEESAAGKRRKKAGEDRTVASAGGPEPVSAMPQLHIQPYQPGNMTEVSLPEDLSYMEAEEGTDSVHIPEDTSFVFEEGQAVSGFREPAVPATEPEPLPGEEKAPADRRPQAFESGREKKAGNSSGAAQTAVAAPQAANGEKKHTTRLEKYAFPPLNLLNKGDNKGSGDTKAQLRETAIHLQQTLQTFGVKVTVTDISQGPAVTRYELQPEPGVKVSKIVSLTDDIKLNLAATDIRIEAPIPGKAAVGIEVPNRENAMVFLRDLLESKEFQTFPANLAFAVGKDIAGKTVVTDIAKMPHMLIAGSTGSGKSVCINTLIMSILYKASPDDVKLIMIDPKVVELSVYNGIPHLLIPVVTDPKKAAGALHWGVAEMTDRYKKFADLNVRDMKGYNKKVEAMTGEDAPAKMPQIVIIVDELADLMMVAPGEVEESICRLAQLARAAGIHLIIATQRPSVDVITGLIKANMPSRVAFAVSSGVDSRTILDMNGAEKLLGKGDMLFYPQGYPKPVRVQGAFVSDKEVSDVVDFLKNQAIGNVYNEDVQEQIQSMGSTSGGQGAGGNAAGRDEYFVDAGRFIIDKEKASIGQLQRAFKIGFNRAARIMDQLYEAGVVGEEEGTKPRKILMSMEAFEQFIEECV